VASPKPVKVGRLQCRRKGAACGLRASVRFLSARNQNQVKASWVLAKADEHDKLAMKLRADSSNVSHDIAQRCPFL
jgi:hypothetical protein